eukprot:CAMPEP_0115348574 /NCGR_PEP_ID=MMETSP0270-20121206/95475_1 /TAXON_ID=71861 /ORGANISM="Scrippsiella trochoidea, Strain CCMP3099" /LENGTH=38 /DNA_ID= /DNA_START= /DNA_END= /DNA_ORIENTATION=
MAQKIPMPKAIHKEPDWGSGGAGAICTARHLLASDVTV